MCNQVLGCRHQQIGGVCSSSYRHRSVFAVHVLLPLFYFASRQSVQVSFSLILSFFERRSVTGDSPVCTKLCLGTRTELLCSSSATSSRVSYPPFGTAICPIQPFPFLFFISATTFWTCSARRGVAETAPRNHSSYNSRTCTQARAALPAFLSIDIFPPLLLLSRFWSLSIFSGQFCSLPCLVCHKHLLNSFAAR